MTIELQPEQISQAISLLIQLFVVVGLPLAGILIRRLVRLLEANVQDQQVRAAAAVAVRAAEQLLPDSHAKYAYAASRLGAAYPALAGHEGELQALIEAAVHELKAGLGPVPVAPVAA